MFFREEKIKTFFNFEVVRQRGLEPTRFIAAFFFRLRDREKDVYSQNHVRR